MKPIANGTLTVAVEGGVSGEAAREMVDKTPTAAVTATVVAMVKPKALPATRPTPMSGRVEVVGPDIGSLPLATYHFETVSSLA